jgi:hypothetical protein
MHLIRVAIAWTRFGISARIRALSANAYERCKYLSAYHIGKSLQLTIDSIVGEEMNSDRRKEELYTALRDERSEKSIFDPPLPSCGRSPQLPTDDQHLQALTTLLSLVPASYSVTLLRMRGSLTRLSNHTRLFWRVRWTGTAF